LIDAREALGNADVKDAVAAVVAGSSELRSLLNDYRTAQATVESLQRVLRELPCLPSAELDAVNRSLPPT
jgi:hypothetical protein